MQWQCKSCFVCPLGEKSPWILHSYLKTLCIWASLLLPSICYLVFASYIYDVGIDEFTLQIMDDWRQMMTVLNDLTGFVSIKEGFCGQSTFSLYLPYILFIIFLLSDMKISSVILTFLSAIISFSPSLARANPFCTWMLWKSLGSSKS